MRETKKKHEQPIGTTRTMELTRSWQKEVQSDDTLGVCCRIMVTTSKSKEARGTRWDWMGEGQSLRVGMGIGIK